MKHSLFINVCIFFVVLKASAANTLEIELPPCPDNPNCVSSQAVPESSHYIEPFKIKDSSKEAWITLKNILNNQSRTKITKQSESLIDAEVKSLIFRFVDNIQFRLDKKTGIIHVRSASRTGYSDLGVNRKRVEEIRKQLRVAGVIE